MPDSSKPQSPLSAPSSSVGSVHNQAHPRSRWMIFYLSLSIILLSALGVSLFLTGYFGRPRQPVSPTPLSNEFVSTVSALPVSPFDFGKYPLADLAPAQTSLYLESSNLRVFLEKFLSQAQVDRLQSLSGLNLSEIASFFEPNFALIEDLSASPSASALIGVGKDLEFIKERVNKIGSQTNLETAIIGPYFIISNSSQYLKEISQTAAKTNLSLSATAPFSEAKKHLPASGQVFIFARNLPSTVKGISALFGDSLKSSFYGLRGTSFVITIKSGSTVIEGADDQ